jgi:hypothetical protein
VAIALLPAHDEGMPTDIEFEDVAPVIPVLDLDAALAQSRVLAGRSAILN